jgi:hypothetical protein
VGVDLARIARVVRAAEPGLELEVDEAVGVETDIDRREVVDRSKEEPGSSTARTPRSGSR